MSRPMSLLDETLEGWAYTRQGVIDEVRNLPERAMTFRPTPQNRTLADLVVHIVDAGLMMSGELSRPDGSFRRKSYVAFQKEYASPIRTGSKRQLLKLLKETHAVGDKALRHAGEILMLQHIVQFNGVRATRLSWMMHGIAHEEYHRGQITLYARLLGEVPALTKLIEGAAG